MVMAGKRDYPMDANVPAIGFAVALLLRTWSILSIEFLVASIVPTARFAPPIGAAILYPMIACALIRSPEIAGAQTPRVFTGLPLTYAVSLLEGI
jgi:ABC-2 type transport system permease protein